MVTSGGHPHPPVAMIGLIFAVLAERRTYGVPSRRALRKEKRRQH